MIIQRILVTTSYKQPSDEPSAVSTNVNNPVPAGITSPLKLKPNTVVADVLTVNPASSAAPPEAPVTSTPSTLNWKPPISSGLEKNTGTPHSSGLSELPPHQNIYQWA